MSTQKPSGSLSNQNVLDIVYEIEQKIAEVQKSIDLMKDVNDDCYSMYIAQQAAYYQCLNLILSKI